MDLADIIGHSEAAARLGTAAASGRLGHAVLLTGPDAVGKTTLALALAELLLDLGRWPGEVTTHPDLWFEDSGTERIGIDRVRGGVEGSLQDFLALRPYAGGARVAIIARADRFTEQAANSLLKALEEPPPGSHLMLAASSPERLPQTILSRCEQVVLGAVATPDIEAWLRARHRIAEATAGLAAQLAAGRPGRALHLATQPEALEAELGALERFLLVGGGGTAGALAAAAEIAPAAGAEGRDRLLVQLAVWTSFARDVAAYAVGAPELARWRSHRRALERWAEVLPADRTVEIVESLLRASADIAAYANPRLTLEVLLLDIFGRRLSPPGLRTEIAG